MSNIKTLSDLTDLHGSEQGNNKTATSVRARSWVYTYFPDNKSDKPDWKDTQHFKYNMYGEEVCPETKKFHLQGYVQFKTPVTRKFIYENDHIVKKYWCEPAVGTYDESLKYVKKQGGVFFEEGEKPKQGKRNDLEILTREKLSNEVIQENVGSLVRYHQNIWRVRTLRVKPPIRNVRIELADNIQQALEKAGAGDYYIHPGTDLWEGYNEENILIIRQDDWIGLDKGGADRIVDGWPTYVPCGGVSKICYIDFIIKVRNK